MQNSPRDGDATGVSYNTSLTNEQPTRIVQHVAIGRMETLERQESHGCRIENPLALEPPVALQPPPIRHFSGVLAPPSRDRPLSHSVEGIELASIEPRVSDLIATSADDRLQFYNFRDPTKVFDGKSSTVKPTKECDTGDLEQYAQCNQQPYELQRSQPSGYGITNTATRQSLMIRQQPYAARTCGYGERDRRVIDPPPIIEVVGDEFERIKHANTYLRTSLYVMHASLLDETGQDVTAFSEAAGGNRKGTRLMGTLAASAIIAYDENGRQCVFFTFPDLSCRSQGRYRLRFALVSLSPTTDRPGCGSLITSAIMSDIFTVYSPKDYGGVVPSSKLTQSLKLQGHSIPVRRGKTAKLQVADPKMDVHSEKNS